MATISIDKDLAEAVKAGRLTHAEAWELRDLRRETDRLDRLFNKAHAEALLHKAALEKVQPRWQELEAKADDSE